MSAGRVLTEKEPGLLAQLHDADPRLYAVVYFAAAMSVEMFASAAVLTGVHRDRAGTIALHGAGAAISPHETTPTRAADLRTRGILDDNQAEEWAAQINHFFEYSPPGPGHRFQVALYETQAKMVAAGRDPNLSPVVPHLHLQVPELHGPSIVRLWFPSPMA